MYACWQSFWKSLLVQVRRMHVLGMTIRTRRRPFMPGENPRRLPASRGLWLAHRELFENGPRNLLGFAEVAQVALELAVQLARLFGAELGAQDHVAETHRMRQERVFLELLERRLDVIVVHRASRSPWVDRGIAG